MLQNLSTHEILSAFLVLFAVIDITGTLPIVITMREEGKDVSSFKAAAYSFLILGVFFFMGDAILKFFQVEVSSFAVAGSIVLFLVAIEMICDVVLFKNQGPAAATTLVPLVFPLIAGAGSFVALISLKASYGDANIFIALALNMLVVYLELCFANPLARLLGKGGLYMMKKFFGIILLAMASGMFTANLTKLLKIVGG